MLRFPHHQPLYEEKKNVGIGNTEYISSQSWDGTIDISHNAIVVYIMLTTSSQSKKIWTKTE